MCTLMAVSKKQGSQSTPTLISHPSPVTICLSRPTSSPIPDIATATSPAQRGSETTRGHPAPQPCCHLFSSRTASAFTSSPSSSAFGSSSKLTVARSLRRGKTRLAKWYNPYSDDEKIKLKGEVTLPSPPFFPTPIPPSLLTLTDSPLRKKRSTASSPPATKSTSPTLSSSATTSSSTAATRGSSSAPASTPTTTSSPTSRRSTSSSRCSTPSSATSASSTSSSTFTRSTPSWTRCSWPARLRRRASRLC